MMRSLLILTLAHYTGMAQISGDLVGITVPPFYIQAGTEDVIRVVVAVKEGYHIQAHDVKDDFVMSTTLSIAATNGLVIAGCEFPPAKKFKLEGTAQSLDVYDGRFEIKILIKVPETIQKQLYRLQSELKYQACDSVHCLFPRNVKFPIDVEVY